MNFPTTPADLPRIRCCNCMRWVSGYPSIFGYCRELEHQQYQNGACPQWQWNATA
ncbi:MAG: hypothetical protein O0X96_05665 [Methanocorpusculum sp.]|nr:hypothetical protein [Methanocorpusculum sp.]MDE2524598.1 hypothetical protein [Methanocorpusculum sp.]